MSFRIALMFPAIFIVQGGTTADPGGGSNHCDPCNFIHAHLLFLFLLLSIAVPDRKSREAPADLK